MFWVLAPYALTFTLPNNSPRQWSFTVTEQITTSMGVPDRYDPNKTDWNLPVKISPDKDKEIHNKFPMNPTRGNIGKDYSTLSWGSVNPLGDGAPVAQVVLTDTPQLSGEMDQASREEATVTITITNTESKLSETWQYTFSLVREANHSPVFAGGELKLVSSK
jgi:hypothetical protein